MKVEFLKASVSTQPGSAGKKDWKLAEVAYKADGKVRSIRVAEFNRAVFDTVTKANTGDVLDVEFEKNAKGFWDMKTAKPTGDTSGGEEVTNTPAKKSTGNWETSEERAQRQVYIIRQSQIEAAIKILQSHKMKLELEDVKKMATSLVNFVLTGE